MGSQLISNAVRSFFLAMVLTALLTGSVAEAASYQKTDGTIVDPMLDRWDNTHSHSRPNLEPGANLTGANLTGANLDNANLANVNPDLGGPVPRDPDRREPVPRGPDQRGPDRRGPDRRGPDLREPDRDGPALRGPDRRGPDQRGPERFKHYRESVPFRLEHYSCNCQGPSHERLESWEG